DTIPSPPNPLLFPYTTLFRSQFEADGEREKARILVEAEAQVEKIQANARKTLEQEMAKLREQLEHELVAQVLEATEAKVRMKLRSEEHTSELQSRENLVCRLL